jgi:broad specificity phosphatase PhoE
MTTEVPVNDVTLQLAKHECAEHMQGMNEVFEVMRERLLNIKAYPLQSPTLSEESKSKKVVHFIRHGQGFHNLMADAAKKNNVSWNNFVSSPNNPYMMPELLDCPLTDLGRQQAALLRDNQVKQFVDNMTVPELIVVSPCCRTLQTASIALQNFIKPTTDTVESVPIVAHELLREETGIHICDKRRSKTQISYEFPSIDFTLLDNEDDPLFQNDKRETKLEVAERIYSFMLWLAKRPERKIVIVSHSGWLLTAFNAIFECSDPSIQEWFQTGELRSVQLDFNQQ